MRLAPPIITVFIFLCTVSSTTANTSAPPPSQGTYLSVDLGGGVYTGRFSESWPRGDCGYAKKGNTMLATSVDGPSMWTQWEISCVSIAQPPTLVSDQRDSFGNGDVTWRVAYLDGEFWLASNGPWSVTSAIDFTGIVDEIVATSTYTYADGVLASVTSSMTLSGRFDPANWNGYCLQAELSNVTFVGCTDHGPLPIEYPPFMATDCTASTAGTGGWGTVNDIEIHIFDCVPSPVRQSTWGHLKSLYSR